MKLLLDSHAFLWALAGGERLGAGARREVGDTTNIVFVSAATVWELSIKIASGKLRVQGDLVREAKASGYRPLHISLEHAAAAGALPRRHGDPFDRMILAQSTIEELTLVTRDRQLAGYGVPILWD